MTTLAKAKAKANETFIVQVSLTIVAYDRQNMFVVQATGYPYGREKFYNIGPSTKAIFDRETKAAYALEIEARDGAPSARPNSGGQPNSG